MDLLFSPLPPDVATGVREPSYLDREGGAPLRCCLRDSRPGDEIVLVTVTPPGPRDAYAESGPVFVHASPCGGPASSAYPPDFAARDQVVRAYSDEGRIVGGRVVGAGTDHEKAARELLSEPGTAFLHTRNVVHGCYMLMIRRT